MAAKVREGLLDVISFYSMGRAQLGYCLTVAEGLRRELDAGGIPNDRFAIRGRDLKSRIDETTEIISQTNSNDLRSYARIAENDNAYNVGVEWSAAIQAARDLVTELRAIALSPQGFIDITPDGAPIVVTVATADLPANFGIAVNALIASMD